VGTHAPRHFIVAERTFPPVTGVGVPSVRDRLSHSRQRLHNWKRLRTSRVTETLRQFGMASYARLCTQTCARLPPCNSSPTRGFEITYRPFAVRLTAIALFVPRTRRTAARHRADNGVVVRWLASILPVRPCLARDRRSGRRRSSVQLDRFIPDAQRSPTDHAPQSARRFDRAGIR